MPFRRKRDRSWSAEAAPTYVDRAATGQLLVDLLCIVVSMAANSGGASAAEVSSAEASVEAPQMNSAMHFTPPARRVAGPAFRDSFCLGVKFAQGQPLSDLPSLVDLGVRWVRDVMPWTAIETAPNAWRELSPSLRKRLEFYRANDIGVVALLTLSNPKAYPATPSDRARPFDAERFGRYAANVAHLLKDFGVRFVLEIGNEPHNGALFKTLGGKWNGRLPSPWVDHYVTMVHEGVRQVKAVDPSIRLLTDDDMWVVHYWFLEAGLPASIDGFAVHPYTPGPPEHTAVAHDTDWTQPFVVVDADRSFSSAVRRLRAQGAAKLGRAPAIWVTEWGWPVGALNEPKRITEDTLASYLPRAYVLAAAAGVEATCWFSAQDSVDGPMGLTDNDGRRRPGYAALKTLSAQLGDYQLVRQVAGQNNPATGVQAYLFQGTHDQRLIVWSVDETSASITLPFLSAVAATGQALARTGDTVQPPLQVTASPIYLTGDWSDEFLDHSFAAGR